VSEGRAVGFPEAAVRARARGGIAEVFPPIEAYGLQMFGSRGVCDDPPAPDHARGAADVLERTRIVPPVFMPARLEKLIDLGREPMFGDVALITDVGGFQAELPLFVSAFGSTRLASSELGIAVARQAGRLGIPVVIGENVAPLNGYSPAPGAIGTTLLERIRAYLSEAPPDRGGVVVQQSTEDADAEVWNSLYTDPALQDLTTTGRLGFELKLGQGAKPGLGGMTVIDPATADRVADSYGLSDINGEMAGVLRSSSPGTFTEDILTQQIRLMRNNFPRVRTWVKLPPGRDIAQVAAVAWSAGADAVTVDGAEAGTGWAPTAFLDHVGLPLGECLLRVGTPAGCLLATGRIWEGSRAVKCLALGATAVGLGRAALIAVDEDRQQGLVRLVEGLALEARMLISALGKYTAAALDTEDLLLPPPTR
jgi:hypothetical protein